jgi:hypothetical protein
MDVSSKLKVRIYVIIHSVRVLYVYMCVLLGRVRSPPANVITYKFSSLIICYSSYVFLLSSH